jgi:hypothetical protein
MEAWSPENEDSEIRNKLRLGSERRFELQTESMYTGEQDEREITNGEASSA